jgi:hypothetical protein
VPLRRVAPAAPVLAIGIASSVPASALPSRRMVAVRWSRRIGAEPSAGTEALHGAQRNCSEPTLSFQAKCTAPKCVSSERPSSQGANHGEVATRMAEGTLTSKPTGPRLMRVCHSPSAGARVKRAISATATQVVITMASSANST